MNTIDATDPVIQSHRLNTRSGHGLCIFGDSGDSYIPPSACEFSDEREINIAGGPGESPESPESPARIACPPPLRPYARCDADLPRKSIYRPGDDPLPLSDDVFQAAIDVMILTFAARRHAEHLATLGHATPDVVRLIRADIETIASLLEASPQSPQVGPRLQAGAKGKCATPGLFGATETNTAKPGASEDGVRRPP